MAGIQSGRRISLNTVWQAAAFPFENTVALIRLALPPLLISAAIIYPASLIAPLIGGQMAYHILTLALYVIVVSVVAVGIHRLILRAEEPELSIPQLRNYEIAYGAAVLVFAAVAFASRGVVHTVALNSAAQWLFQPIDTLIGWIWPRFAVQFILMRQSPGLNATLFLLAAMLIWPAIRLALVFPHAAVSGQLSFGESWAVTRGNVWRLIGVAALLALIVYGIAMVIGLLAAALIALKSTVSFLLAALLALVWGGLQFTMFVALVSYIYKELVGGADPAAPLQSDLPAPLRPGT